MGWVGGGGDEHESSGRSSHLSTMLIRTFGTVSIALVFAAVVLDQACRHQGLHHALVFSGTSLALVVAGGGAITIGFVVAIRRPEHPVGWLIWSLGLEIFFAGAVVSYAAVGLLGSEALPGARVAAGVANAAFVPWLTILTLIFALTPSGRIRPGWETRSAVCTGVVGVVFMAARAVRPGALDPPLDSLTNPIGVGPAVAPLVRLAIAAGGLAVNAGLVGSVALIGRRFYRSDGEERAQLKWVAVGALAVLFMAPVPAMARNLLSPAASDLVVSVVVGIAIVLALLGIGASVLRYRLYDVETVLSTGASYLILTVLVISVFIVVTLGLGQLSTSRGSSALRVGVSTLAAAGVAGLVRHRAQELVDRRFRRRRYDAATVMRDFVDGAGRKRDDAELALREATGDQSICVGYPRDPDGRLVAADGSPFVPASSGQRGRVVMSRDDVCIAVIDHDETSSPADLVRDCGAIALAELDNIRLRAELRTRLVEVEDSRSRLAEASSAERRRLERNLHDGAQQRIVGVMVALQTTAIRAERGVVITEALQDAIGDLGAAVRELRELANGLVPALLARDGLEAAIRDLAERCPLPVEIDARLPRLSLTVEETAYYVVAEGLANAMKHARAQRVVVTARMTPTVLSLEVVDDGIGGADPQRPGLVGVADRVRGLGGMMQVASPPGQGTALRVELPCGS